MRIWVRFEDIPSVAFLVPKATQDKYQQVGFHISIPMGYMESAAFFCATTKTVNDQALDTLSTRNTAPPHHQENLVDTKLPHTSAAEVATKLEDEENWEDQSPHARDTALAHFGVYLNDFIGIVQVGTDDWTVA